MKQLVPVLALLLVAGSAAAARPPAARFVLVVANNHSVTPGTADLRFADDDGVAWFELLRPYARQAVLLTVPDDETQQQHPGIAAVAEPPSQERFRARLAALYGAIAEEKARGGATELYFVFAGHGGLDAEGRGFVHLSDGPLGRAELFEKVIGGSPAAITHVIVDACNAFSLVAGRGEGGAPSSFDSFLAGHDLAAYPSVGVLVATTEDRETHEWSKIHAGVFSHQLRSALHGGADVNRDGLLEYSEVAAFVDAASGPLASVGKRITTFSWPPARDRRAPLLDLRAGEGIREVVLREELAGRFWVEGAHGERLAELNKPPGQAVALALPGDAPLFLRDGKRELAIPPGTEAVSVEDPPSTPYEVASRGAVDQAFEQGLFSQAFGWDFYRGFVGGRKELLAVDPPPLTLASLPPRSEPLLLEGGYVAGPALLLDSGTEHGAFLRLHRRLGGPLAAGLGAEGGFASAPQGVEATGVFRVALAPGLSARARLGERLALAAALDAGWELLGISGPAGSVDPSVFLGRGRASVEVRLGETTWLFAGGGAATHLVTADGGERWETRPEVAIGIGGR